MPRTGQRLTSTRLLPEQDHVRVRTVCPFRLGTFSNYIFLIDLPYVREHDCVEVGGGGARERREHRNLLYRWCPTALSGRWWWRSAIRRRERRISGRVLAATWLAARAHLPRRPLSLGRGLPPPPTTCHLQCHPMHVGRRISCSGVRIATCKRCFSPQLLERCLLWPLRVADHGEDPRHGHP